MVKKIDTPKNQRFESTSNVSDIFEHALECIARIDRQGNYLSVNADYAEVYGYQPEDMMGMRWIDTIHRDDLDSAENACNEMFELGRSEVNLRGIRKNATVFYNHIVMVKGLENEKSPVSHYCFIQDITDQTLEERKLYKEVEYNYHKFQYMVELQPECFKQVGRDGELIYMNTAGLALIEADSLQQVKGICIYDLIAEEHREKFKSLNQRVFDGETDSLEFEIVGLKGKRKWMETHACPVADSSGFVFEHLAITRDITERKQIEIVLKDREQQYSTLISDIDAIVWEVSLPSLLFTFVSEPAKKMLGYPLDDWYQNNFWLDHIHPDDREEAVNYCSLQTEHGKDHQFEYRMLAADGSIVWIKDLVHVVQDKSGAPEKLRGVMFDITHQKETEAAYKSSQDRLSVAIETSPDIIVITRLSDGKIIEVNKGFIQATGFSEEEAIGKTSIELKIWSSNKDREKYVKLLQSNGYISNYEFEFNTKNGETYPGTISASLVEHNGEQCTLSITRDITSIKHTEALLTRTNRALMVINQCDRSLVHIDDEKELLQSVCDIIINIGNYRMSWVGYAEHDEDKKVIPIALSGYEEDYLKNKMSWADVPSGRGPTGICIRTQKPYICRDIATEINFSPWRASALERGYASMIALPIRIDGYSFGAIMIYSAVKNAFDIEEVELLEHLADNLSYGIRSIRIKKEALKSEKIFKLENEIFQLIHDDPPINELSSQIINKVEQVLLETKCSIFFIDDEGTHLQLAAAPSLSSKYIDIVDGIEIKPNVCSCCSAALYNRRVIISDIDNDSRWKKYSKIVRGHNIKASYSTPIRATDGLVIGTFTNYYDKAKEPDADELNLIEHVTRIIGVAFERKRVELALKESDERFTLAMEGASDGLWDWKINTNDIYYSPRWISMLGYKSDDIKNGIEQFTALLHPEDIERTFTHVDDYTAGKINKFSIEFRMLHKDGHYVDILSRGFGVRNSNGDVFRMVGTHVDISMRKHSEHALKNSEEKLRHYYDAGLIGMALSSPDKGWIDFNDTFCDITGYSREELMKISWADLTHPDDLQSDIELFNKLTNGEIDKYSLEKRYIKKDGSNVNVNISVSGHREENGIIEYYIALISDISEQKRISAALAASESQFRTLYDDTPAMFFNTSKDGIVLTVNEYGANHLGYDVSELKGKNVLTIIHKNDRKIAQEKIKQCFKQPDIVHRWDLRKEHKNGHIIMVRESVRVVSDAQGEPTLFIVCEDISEAFRLSEELSFQATHDALTGLVNRSEFERRLQRVIEANQSSSGEHAICYLDLDQFKIINDTCGHLAGDELLRQLSEILLSKVRKRDTLARLGGDEFGVLMEHCDIEHARRVTDSLRASVEEFRFVWQDKKFSIGVSIGLVPLSIEIGNVNEVLSAADAACYAAKDAGRNRVHIYSVDDKQVSQHRGEMKWVPRINQALEEDLFVLYYQKIVPIDQNANDGEHYELLIRMIGKDGEFIPPGAFLPAAERFGLSTKIDHWVVSSAFSWLATHPAKQKKLELCTINLSGQTLGNEDFMGFLIDKLDENLVNPNKICFEITETSAVANLSNAIRFIKKIKEKGCQFALDDFGSGVSSFGYLKNLPVDFLKIDGSFVRDIKTDRIDRAMVKSINEIGQIMGKQTIAEFVENDAILQELKKIGVDYAQGYGIAKPRALRYKKRKK